jgi:exopolysaccharide biosynthesis protein
MHTYKSINSIKIKRSKAVKLLLAACFFVQGFSFGQLKWVNVDSLFQPLPKSFHVYKTTDSLDGKPFVAYYAEAAIKDKKLNFTTDTTYKRRLTPLQFYEKNNKPLLVVNGTFFSFTTNQNLNLVIKEGKLVSYNVHTIAGKAKDTLTYLHPFGSAIGISKKRKADVAWLYTDSSKKHPYFSNTGPVLMKDSIARPKFRRIILKRPFNLIGESYYFPSFYKWRMKTAVGGGPVLLQNGEIKITNEEELKFTGKAIDDKHPRTAMGYTDDNRLIILVIQGRFPGIAEGASLKQEAQILKHLGCREALNLDGGGSSCMLINGKETIKPSDKEGQRAIPAVFIIGAQTPTPFR